MLHRYRYLLKSLSDGQRGSALFLEDDQGQSHELVEGVGELNFQYLPNQEQSKAIVVNFTIKNKQVHGDSRWQFIIPLLEQI